MLDKEKINEMASDMQYGCVEHDLWPNDAKEIAKALIILGYQKVKKDEIVISKKEYEELKQDCADIAEHYQEMGRFYDEKCEECDRKAKEMEEKFIAFLNYYMHYDRTYLIEELKKYLAEIKE